MNTVMTTCVSRGAPFAARRRLTSGVISGLGREMRSPTGRPITNVIQTDATRPRLYREETHLVVFFFKASFDKPKKAAESRFTEETTRAFAREKERERKRPALSHSTRARTHTSLSLSEEEEEEEEEKKKKKPKKKESEVVSVGLFSRPPSTLGTRGGLCWTRGAS